MQRLDANTWTGFDRAFYQSKICASAVLICYKTKHGLPQDTCSLSTVTRLIDKFEAFGCICDRPLSSRPSLSEETIQGAES